MDYPNILRIKIGDCSKGKLHQEERDELIRKLFGETYRSIHYTYTDGFSREYEVLAFKNKFLDVKDASPKRKKAIAKNFATALPGVWKVRATIPGGAIHRTEFLESSEMSTRAINKKIVDFLSVVASSDF